MNCKKTAKTIESFIREKTNFCNGAVIGLSGGIDSTVVAYLAVNVIGKDRVFGRILPYYRNQNTDDAIEIAEMLGIKYDIIDIKPNFESYENNRPHKKIEGIAKQNLISRIRMCWLRLAANEENMLLLGTSNKSELMIGYVTKGGDSQIDNEPIGDLYKTEVWELARYIKKPAKIPNKIIDKTPSADLSPNQTDEADIGMDYFTLDKILKGETEGIDIAKIKRVEELIRNSQHKRETPPVCYIEK